MKETTETGVDGFENARTMYDNKWNTAALVRAVTTFFAEFPVPDCIVSADGP